MNKDRLCKITLATVSIVSVFSVIAPEPAQAANIKEWQIDFFDNAGDLVGEGSFSYNLETETFIPDNFYNDEGFFVQTGIDSFSARPGEYEWSLADFAGYYWWNPETQTPKQEAISRTGLISREDSWFFGDPYFSEYVLILDGTQGSGTWLEAISYDFLNEEFDEREDGYYKVYSTGSWEIKPVPEPTTLFGLIAVFGFGLFFPQKQG